MSRIRNIRLGYYDLPIIQTLEDLSLITHISKYTIYQFSKNSNKHYKIYSIPKTNGEERIIRQPSKKMKGLQSWILVNILNKLKVAAPCKGFEKKSSIIDNVLPHIEANILITIDIRDFFDSIGRRKVFNVFKMIGYNDFISTIFTNICTFKDILPQGSPCSPKLANLVSMSMDNRIQGYVGKRGITYTRYADDLSFSGYNPGKVIKILPMIKSIIQDEGFSLNSRKTRIAGSARAKIITGLVLSNDSFGIGKKKYKILRAKIHYLTLNKNKDNFKLLNHVKGWLSYLRMVDIDRYKKTKLYISKLKNKYSGTMIEKLTIK
jgi:hypothetical protein